MPHGKIIHAAPYISLAEFRPAGRNKIKIMLSGGFADRKHTARLASVEFCALAQNYARSRGASPLPEKASAFSGSPHIYSYFVSKLIDTYDIM